VHKSGPNAIEIVFANETMDADVHADAPTGSIK